MFFGPDGLVCSVIDRDNSGYGSRTAEMVRTMALSFDVEPVRCRAFLHAYRGHRSVDIDELDTEAQIYSWSKLHDMWLFDTVYLRGDPSPSRFIGPGSYQPFVNRWADVRRSIS